MKPRLGERYASALTKISNNRRIIAKYGKIDLKGYVTSFIKIQKKYENKKLIKVYKKKRS